MGLFKEQSGGFSGAIQDITFETKEWASERTGKGYSTLTAHVVIAKDGADGPMDQFLPAGFFYPERGWSVSKDGKTLEGGAGIDKDSEFARLVQTAVEGGFPEAALLDADGNGTNFSSMTAKRYEFGREMDKVKQLASGRKKLHIKGDGLTAGGKTYTEEEVLAAGKRQDKTDKAKFYNHLRLVVKTFLGDAVGPKAAAKPAARAATTTPDTDVEQLAEGLLIEFLAGAKDNVVGKDKLTGLIVARTISDAALKDKREPLRKVMLSEAFLNKTGLWAYDPSGKGTITLAQ